MRMTMNLAAATPGYHGPKGYMNAHGYTLRREDSLDGEKCLKEILYHDLILFLYSGGQASVGRVDLSYSADFILDGSSIDGIHTLDAIQA